MISVTVSAGTRDSAASAVQLTCKICLSKFITILFFVLFVHIGNIEPFSKQIHFHIGFTIAWMI